MAKLVSRLDTYLGPQHADVLYALAKAQVPLSRSSLDGAAVNDLVTASMLEPVRGTGSDEYVITVKGTRALLAHYGAADLKVLFGMFDKFSNPKKKQRNTHATTVR